MKFSGPRWLGAGVSAAVLSAVLGLSAAGGTLVLTSTPAFAQTALDSSQIAAIQASLTAALRTTNGNAVLTENAISQVVVDAISLYGSDATASIVSAIMGMAEHAGIAEDVIGKALADAAATEAATNTSAANVIASTVANEGKTAEISAFQARATALGYANLAAIAGAGGKLEGEAGGVPATGGNANAFSGGFTGGGSGGGGGGCLNPSCTKL